MDFSDKRSKLILGVIAVVFVGLLYFLWMRSAPPAAAPLPGQTIFNPMGKEEPDVPHGNARRAARPPGESGR